MRPFPYTPPPGYRVAPALSSFLRMYFINKPAPHP